MKLSQETFEILKNFSGINSNIAMGTEGVLRSVATAKNVMAKAGIAEKFPYDFGIYDLPEFLSAYGMFDNPELLFDESKNFVTIEEGGSSVKYFFSDIETLTVSTKDVNLPDTVLEFTLSESQLNALRRASGALKSNDITVSRSANGLSVSVSDVTNATSNAFTLEVTDCDIQADESFDFVFNINNFKFVNADSYVFKVSSKMIGSVDAADVTYWVALDKSSKYGV